ncbi:hypothetical protein BU15DRAFT_66022 [Melanogaster broomeanus]|nr:hypothetical protein BU15DRAFT_66022 [Melanogaster broomeanus]
MSNKSNSFSSFPLLPLLDALIARGFTIEQIIEGNTSTGEQQLLFSSTAEAASYNAYLHQGGNNLMGLGSPSSSAGLTTQYSNAPNQDDGHVGVGDFHAGTAAQSSATVVPNQNHAPLTLQAATHEHTCQLSGDNKERSMVQCPWTGCIDVLRRRNIPRHIRSVHLGVRVQCGSFRYGVERDWGSVDSDIPVYDTA